MVAALRQLLWLRVEQRSVYKLCLFMHYIHIAPAPKYLSDCVSTVSAASGSSGVTKGGRGRTTPNGKIFYGQIYKEFRKNQVGEVKKVRGDTLKGGGR